MTENEQLARWLGWKYKKKLGWFYPPFGFYTAGHPDDFHTSNEWAGALLTKLKPYVLGIDTVGTRNDWRIEIYDSPPFIAPSWRDAVVDAALWVIKREQR